MKNKALNFTAAIFGIMLLFAQYAFTASNSGKEFWLMFPYNNDGSAYPSLIITGQQPASGTVTVPGMAFSAPFTVVPGTVTTVNLPYGCYTNTSDGTQPRAIHVVSSDSVTVYGMYYLMMSTDAYLGLPLDALGTDYMVLSYSPAAGRPQVGIAAAYDNTTVTIISNVTIPLTRAVAGVPFSFVMNTGDAYQLVSSAGDLTGCLISSDKPISVFGSNSCADIPVSATYCNYIVEQLPPITAWGKHFLSVPLATRTKGDTFRFLASVDNTTVQVNGATVATLNKGNYYEAQLTQRSYITSDKPILVAQYSDGTSFDGVINADPSMMLIFPMEQFMNNYTVSTPSTGMPVNYLNIVVDTADAGNILLDGAYLPAAGFAPIGASGYSGEAVYVGVGTHNISSLVNFGVNVYGFAVTDAYSYPGGGGFTDLLHTPTVTPTITNSPSITMTPTITQTATISPTASLTGTITMTQTSTPTFTATPTFTVTSTSTTTPTYTPTFTVTPTVTATSTSTITPTYTPTYSVTVTNTSTITNTPSVTRTVTCTNTVTDTLTPTPIPLLLKGKGNYPNPFVKDTQIVYWLSTDADVKIKIYTVSGEVVRWEQDLHGLAGYNHFYWDGRNRAIKPVASGVFIYRISASTPRDREQSVMEKCACVK